MSATHLTRVSRFSPGVTLAELVVAMTIIPMIIGVFIYFIYTGIYSTQRSNILLSLDVGLQDAMDVIERDIRFARSFNKTLPTRFSDPYGANNLGSSGSHAWSFRGVPSSETSRVLLLEVPSTVQSSLSSARQPVFRNDGEFNCSTQLTLNPELTHSIIYFLRDSALYRRILTDTTTPTCNNAQQNQKQSCPGYISPWHDICGARDERIADNVSEFRVAYYRASGINPIASTYTSSDPDILKMANDAEVAITAVKPYASDDVVSTIKLRVGMVNANNES